jgi:two-component system phosphate regulon sensor histidine kinase PhoR
MTGGFRLKILIYICGTLILASGTVLFLSVFDIISLAWSIRLLFYILLVVAALVIIAGILRNLYFFDRWLGLMWNNLSKFTDSSQKQAHPFYPDLQHRLSDRVNDLLESHQQITKTRDDVMAVLSSISNGIIVVDHTKTIRWINRAACRIFDIEEGQARGQTLINVVGDFEIVNVAEQSLETGSEVSSIITFGPHRTSLGVVATPLPDGVSCLLLFQDLTEIKRSELENRDLMSNISHELRTPVASIKALAESLEGGAIEDRLTAIDFLQRIVYESDRLANMLQDLGALSSMQAGSPEFKKSLFPPEDIIGRVMNRLKGLAGRQGLSIETSIVEELPWIRADRDKIETVLVNLIYNAIKYTPNGGRITIGAREEDKKILFSVRDTGVGISAEDMPRIFERFYKADKARSGGGSGLGLAISKQIVELHGGSMHVESTEGKGSTFYFSIPI